MTAFVRCDLCSSEAPFNESAENDTGLPKGWIELMSSGPEGTCTTVGQICKECRPRFKAAWDRLQGRDLKTSRDLHTIIHNVLPLPAKETHELIDAILASRFFNITTELQECPRCHCRKDGTKVNGANGLTWAQCMHAFPQCPMQEPLPVGSPQPEPDPQP